MRPIPYATQWIDKEDVTAVSCALMSDYLTQGPQVIEFEKKIAEYCEARYAVAVNSGTSALHIACLAARIQPGDDVIVSPISFVASSNCILYCGGRPVFTDIQEDTINIDPVEIKKKITSRTKAIIPIHFAGHPCDLEDIYHISKEHGLIVIEDAAHALGAKYKGDRIGSCKYSDMAILSFHAVKHITTGEGGMVLTNDKDLYEKLLMFRSHGITRNKMKFINKDTGAWYYEMQLLGFNYRLTDFQCALGMRQFEKLNGFIRRRREIAKRYDGAFNGLEGLSTPNERTYVESSWHLYIVRVKKARERVFEALREKGIEANVHYVPIYQQPYYQKLGYEKGICPKAERYYKEAITLPLYPKMKGGEIKYVVKGMKDAIKSNFYLLRRPIVGIIVQARMDSSRLPGKVMMPLAGEPVLYRVMERLSDCKHINKIVIATTRKEIDEPIVSLAKKMNIDCYRGSERDVLSRYYGAAHRLKLDIVVRITADCPLIDPEILDEMIVKFKALNDNGRYCDYLSNTLERTFPDGLDIEIFWYDVLKEAHIKAKKQYQREHVTPYIIEHSDIFQLVNYFSSYDDMSKYRWTLDEEDDYRLICEIYERLYSLTPKFHFKDILNLFEKEPQLVSINAHVK